MVIKKARFVKSMRQIGDYLDLGFPEIAIVGRSNSGKSSLINCLSQNSKLARVSKEAGKTRLINFFLLNEDSILVDLPGYGYAKVSKSEKNAWEGMVEAYFSATRHLQAIFVLMDIRHKPNEFDKKMLFWAQYNCVPFILVATKADKISKAQRKQHTDAILKELGIQAGIDIVAFSSLNKTGREELLKVMEKFYDRGKEE